MHKSSQTAKGRNHLPPILPSNTCRSKHETEKQRRNKHLNVVSIVINSDDKDKDKSKTSCTKHDFLLTLQITNETCALLTEPCETIVFDDHILVV